MRGRARAEAACRGRPQIVMGAMSKDTPKPLALALSLADLYAGSVDGPLTPRQKKKKHTHTDAKIW